MDLKKLSDNFYITYREESVRKTPDNLKKIPNEFHCIPMSGKTQYTISEFLCYILYFKLNISNRFIENRIDRLYKREWKRLFGSTDVSCAIQFTGYEYGIINMFRCFWIWHNNRMIMSLKKFGKIVVVVKTTVRCNFLYVIFCINQ